jgi:hypothetical protein
MIVNDVKTNSVNILAHSDQSLAVQEVGEDVEISAEYLKLLIENSGMQCISTEFVI